MQKITPFLWFDEQAEEAMLIYTSVFRNSKPGKVSRNGSQVFSASFELDGLEFIALNGGPQFKFTEAISMYVNCEGQEEVDYYWQKLTENGGAESAMRLAEGQVRPFLANHSGRAASPARRSGPGQSRPGNAGDAEDEEDRRRRFGGCRQGLISNSREQASVRRRLFA